MPVSAAHPCVSRFGKNRFVLTTSRASKMMAPARWPPKKATNHFPSGLSCARFFSRSRWAKKAQAMRLFDALCDSSVAFSVTVFRIRQLTAGVARWLRKRPLSEFYLFPVAIRHRDYRDTKPGLQSRNGIFRKNPENTLDDPNVVFGT